MAVKRRNSPIRFQRVKRQKTSVPPVANARVAMKGEVKHKDFVISAAPAPNALTQVELTAITEGAGKDYRVGDKIHVLGVDIGGYTGASFQTIDTHLCSPSDNHIPIYADYIGAIGGLPANNLLTDWWHQTGPNKGGGTILRRNYRFKYPLEVTYSGSSSTAGLRNKLFFCLVNNSAASSAGVNMHARIYYQDN